MKDDRLSPDEIIRGATGLLAVATVGFLGPACFIVLWGWRNPAAVRQLGTKRLILSGAILAVLSCLIWYLWLDSAPLYRIDALRERIIGGLSWLTVARVFVGGWGLGAGSSLIGLPVLILFRKSAPFIRLSDIRTRVRDFRKCLQLFEDPRMMPIGIESRSGDVIALSEERRQSHVIILGATGAGKTTLLCNMVLHGIRHGRPCVVIDPKGDDSTLEWIVKVGRHLTEDFDSRLRVFRMSKPSESCKYNPLKHGNAIQLKDRIMEALNWSEQYYQSIAGDFLTVLTACYERLGIGLDLDSVSRVLGEKRDQHDLLRRLKDSVQQGDQGAESLYRRLSSLLEKMKADDLHGLYAQLSILNNPRIGHLLSFKESGNEIDFRDVIRRRQIAYFQLDTLGNPDTARRLGRMIVEDLKGLASEVYGTVPETERTFFPIFIDEFGSFASREFIEVLKQIRGARFGAHLFCQGFEDLDAVSKEFRRQAGANPITKIGFRLDDADTVNAFCYMAGTVEALEQSYQVEGTIAPMKTGMGNLRETRQLKVEPDVLKNLNIGQAVVVEKSPSRVFAIDVFHPSILAARPSGH